MLAAGAMMTISHHFLCVALDSTTQHALTVIITFETWPLIYFAQTLILNRAARSEFSLRDTLLVLVAFLGFMTLAAQNIDIADWLLAKTEFLYAVGWALIGAIGMSVTTHFTRSAIDVISASSTDAADRGVAASTVAEAIRRAIFSLVLIAVTVSTGQTCPADPLTIGIAGALGIATLSLASIFYYTSLSRSKSPAIVMLWYTMPIMSICFSAAINGRAMSEYEAIAAALIVSANILLNSKLDLSSPFKLLYFFMIAAGFVTVFAEPVGQDYYLEIVSGGLILYGLLAAGALTRVSAAVRAREAALLDIQYKLTRGGTAPEDLTKTSGETFLTELEDLIAHGKVTPHGRRLDDVPDRFSLLLYRLRLTL